MMMMTSRHCFAEFKARYRASAAESGRRPHALVQGYRRRTPGKGKCTVEPTRWADGQRANCSGWEEDRGENGLVEAKVQLRPESLRYLLDMKRKRMKKGT